VSSTFGRVFTVTTWGESHGGGVGAVVDGCPSKLPLTEDDIQPDLDRRRPGQSRIVTQRKESDIVKILSGTFEGKTLGTPISLMIPNEDVRPDDYRDIEKAYRPSHADYTYEAKYGIRNWMGGGRSSARETAGRVAAGAIAKKLLKATWDVEVIAWVSAVRDIGCEVDMDSVSLEGVEATPARCPDQAAAEKMIEAIEAARKGGNSLGGVITCALRGCPVGWGDPVFDKFEADLAKAMLSLPASKGFDIGSGFDGTLMTGQEHNDEFFTDDTGNVRTRSNRSGGIQGGITNGETVYFRVGFKPTATVMRDQKTVSTSGKEVTLSGRGRHDPCVLPRAVPMVEAMAALVAADHALLQRAIRVID
jgi:chorismate synthase